MPAPTTVADGDIIEAGRRLQSAGKSVTGWTLRAALGTGRASRLGEVWDAHVAETAPGIDPAPSPSAPLPAALEEQASILRNRVAGDLDAFVSEIWTSAERIAGERTRAETDAAAAAARSAATDLEAASEAIAAIETDRDAAVSEAERLTSMLVIAQAEAAAQRGRADAAELRADRLEGAAREAAEDRGRLLQRIDAMAMEARTRTPSTHGVEAVDGRVS